MLRGESIKNIKLRGESIKNIMLGGGGIKNIMFGGGVVRKNILGMKEAVGWKMWKQWKGGLKRMGILRCTIYYLK